MSTMPVIGQGLRDVRAIVPRRVPPDLEMQGWTSTASGVASCMSPLEAGCINLGRHLSTPAGFHQRSGGAALTRCEHRNPQRATRTSVRGRHTADLFVQWRCRMALRRRRM
jgi:hypothetical protein